MKGLTRFLKYYLVSSFFILTPISCDNNDDVVNEEMSYNLAQKSSLNKLLLTREDSIKQLAIDLNIEFDDRLDNINTILDKILIQKRLLIKRLDSLDARSDEMERLAYEYKKKEHKLEKERLLKEIASIKKELEKIKRLSNGKIKIDSKSIPETKIPDVSTFENLPPGNYVTRLDKYHLISIYVKKNGEIIIGKPRLDSTTVLRGSKNISPRLKKELDAIRKRLKQNN